MAKSRLISLNGKVPDNMVFLHGNALQLPFKPGSFGTAISLNLLHALEDVKTVLHELKNALNEHGTMHLTTLVKGDRFADLYLSSLGRGGALVPRGSDQLLTVFSELEIPTTHTLRGNLLFISSQ